MLDSVLNTQTTSLLTFLTYVMLHEKSEFARVTDEMIRSGIMSAPDGYDLFPEQGDIEADGRDPSATSKCCSQDLEHAWVLARQLLRSSSRLYASSRLYPSSKSRRCKRAYRDT